MKGNKLGLVSGSFDLLVTFKIHKAFVYIIHFLGLISLWQGKGSCLPRMTSLDESFSFIQEGRTSPTVPSMFDRAQHHLFIFMTLVSSNREGLMFL